MCISVPHLPAPLLTIIPAILNRYLFCFSFVFFTAPIDFILSFVRIKQAFLRSIIRCPPVSPGSSEHVCTFLMPVCFPLPRRKFQATPHKESCDALRKFRTLTLLRFHCNTSSITAKPRLVSTQNLLANRSCPIMRYCLNIKRHQGGEVVQTTLDSYRTAIHGSEVYYQYLTEHQRGIVENQADDEILEVRYRGNEDYQEGNEVTLTL